MGALHTSGCIEPIISKPVVEGELSVVGPQQIGLEAVLYIIVEHSESCGVPASRRSGKWHGVAGTPSM
jgi:hypothetical protein